MTSAIRPLWYFKCRHCGYSYVHQSLEALPVEEHIRCDPERAATLSGVLSGVGFLLDLVENWARIEWQVDGGRPR